MLGIRRRVMVGFVAMLVFVLLVTGTVGARWIRLGDGGVTMQLDRVCLDGFEFTGAYVQFIPNDLQPRVRYVYARMYRSSIFDLGDGSPPDLYEDSSLQDYFPRAESPILGFGSFEMRPQLSPIIADDIETYYYGRGRVRFTREFNQLQYVAAFYTFRDVYTGPSSGAEFFGEVLAAKAENCFLFSDSVTILNPSFPDGRSNDFDYGATAAIFCEDNSVKVYGINAESQGFFAFSVTQDEIDALGQPATNTLLDSFPSPFGGDIRLYLLTTGELQLNAPGLPPESWKEYVFTWAGCKA